MRRQGCSRAPHGWKCVRGMHSGPCTTSPAWWNLTGWFWGRTKALR
jgi:hypothetical protein